ncbi:MAG TPA: hypothetical protein VNY05_34965, partial [Candidatus Acidoferrales bacterium]|nr:hypothetical protein [Candidatus Acidoferrales bacterium]
RGLLAGRLLRDLDQGWLAGGIHTSSMEQVLQNEKYFVITRAEFFTASHGRGSDVLTEPRT